MHKQSKLKALLIDDDPVFGCVMRNAAVLTKLDLDYCESLADLGSVGLMNNFDLIICDFYLADFDGNEIAKYVSAFLDDTPVVIISGDENIAKHQDKWPKCVKGFVSKRGRPDVMLERAMVMAGLN